MRIADMLYAFMNPLVRGLLRSPLHGIGSGNLAILCYEGRQSRKNYATPLSYVREGDRILFLSSRQTRWWCNFADGPTPVEVEIARTRLSGQAELFNTASEAQIEGTRLFLTRLPRDAVIYGVKLDPERKPTEASLRKAAQAMILVQVELDPDPETGPE